MKPATHTSAMGMSVGAPWEILRSNTLAEDKRIIDFYTKSGDFGLYHSLIAAITDYDLVMTVLSGGEEVSIDPDTRTRIFSTVAGTLIPAIDKAAREEASSSDGYTGTYIDKSTNSTLELSMDSGAGVVIKKFVVRGFDALSNMPHYTLSASPPSEKAPQVNGRIYPVDINGNSPFKRNHARDVPKKYPNTFTMWRAYFDTTTEEENKAKDDSLFYVDGSCETWFDFDQTSYDYISLGEFVFVHDKRGSVRAVQSPAFDVTFGKIA